MPEHLAQVVAEAVLGPVVAEVVVLLLVFPLVVVPLPPAAFMPGPVAEVPDNVN